MTSRSVRRSIGESSRESAVDYDSKGRRSHAMDTIADEDLSIAASDDDLQSALDDSRVSVSGKGTRDRNAPIDMVRRETRAVNCLRYLIVLLLTALGIGMSIGIYRLETQVEEKNGSCFVDGAAGAFETNEATLDKYVLGLQRNLVDSQTQLLTSAHTLSTTLTSNGMNSEGVSQPWPFITISHFDPLTQGLLALDEVDEVRFAPLVDPDERLRFENYAAVQQQTQCAETGSVTCPVFRTIYNLDGTPVDLSTASSPVWQIAPFDAANPGYRMMNQLSDPIQAEALQEVQSQGAAVWSGIQDDSESGGSAHMLLFYPVVEDLALDDLAGSLGLQVDVSQFLQRAIPFTLSDDVTILVSKSQAPCSMPSSSHSFLVQNDQVSYTGLVEPDATSSIRNSAESAILDLPVAFGYGEFHQGLEISSCPMELVVVPSSVLAESQDSGSTRRLMSNEGSGRAVGLTATVACAFFLIIVVFWVYDWLVERRQSVVINIATKSTAIVENLFPAPVRDRMYQNILEEKKKGNNGAGTLDPSGLIGDAGATPVENLAGGAVHSMRAGTATSNTNNQVSVKQFLTTPSEAVNDFSSQPIADLFPNTTVFFADIAGFTAWSSQRDPPQVFTLLETLYRSFDVIAAKLKVFKVETIGDCYMAVTGLPNPDEQHAVHMSRFAYQCLVGMKELIRELEAILGPGTSDLSLRVGLHSGPVTAGVLRGEKSRFQLFGDTVNTASRMESTGERGKIQVSQETADLLMAAGKSHWLKPREELITAKGKGELKTYWLDPTKKRRHTKALKDIRVAQEIALNNGAGDPSVGPGEVPFDDKYARLIDWNVDVLLHHLARVISCRSRSPARGSLVNHSSEVALLPAAINDVAEVVALPPFDADASKFRRARPDVSMLQQTRADLHEYVKRIALMYWDVPFHNFEHASHVTLCANKLLNRLINSDEYESEEALHNATYGISSDPLTHFAIVFSALIHDAEHQGVPNAQLVKDKDELAIKFDNKSVAEQNSVHLGWELLMDPRFERLRKCIYQTNVERKRFRQLVINCVLATDIADRQVNENRKEKWEKAFRSSPAANATPLQLQEDMNRKSTAVIEHIVQVSDVAHTMQHWHIYRRWNERLFHEMHDAYQAGRVVVDPSTNWYIGELGFFDYYLIPLAMRLKECGVFGASGYEYISYVLKNKKEWERKGRQVVQEMVLLYKDANDEEGQEDNVSVGSEDYDSDDLEYDSPGDLSSEAEAGEDIESLGQNRREG